MALSGSAYGGVMTTYRVVVSRDGDGLLARVDGMPAALADGRSIGEVDRKIRGVIAFLERLPDDAAAHLGIVFVDAQMGGVNEGLAAPPTGEVAWPLTRECSGRVDIPAVLRRPA